MPKSRVSKGPIALIGVALLLMGVACPGFAGNDEKKQPLKGEIRTERVKSNSPETRELPKDSDPFSDDAVNDMRAVPRTEVRTAPRTEVRTAPRTEVRIAPRPEVRPAPRTEVRPAPRTKYGINQPTMKPLIGSAKIDVNYQKGIAAEKRGDLATAIENFVYALNNDPSNPLFSSALRRVEMKFKAKCPKFHAYTSYFTGKRDARLLLNYGVRFYSLSCFQQAERLFNQAALLDPTNPNSHFNLGVIYEHNGQLAKALTEYQKSLSLFESQGPDLPASAVTLAQNARKQALRGKIAKVSHERRRYSGMEDPKNGLQLAQEAVDSVLQQMNGKPAKLPKWPTLTVNQRTPTKRDAAPSRHVDTCDHCLIIRDIEMWPN
jgi:tetratricopeptide (TPR) repeat protein